MNLSSVATQHGFTFKAYRGCGSVLLAFNLEDHLVEHLAGFAIKRTGPDGKSAFLLNRINFTVAYTSNTTAETREWTSSEVAPFQKFWWTDFPPLEQPGEYTYEATVMRFTSPNKADLKPDQSIRVTLKLGPFQRGNFALGFTRGYLSSQAYADKVASGEFKNSDVRPAKTLDYDTAVYQPAYKWLGFEARKMIWGFLDECLRDGSSVDVFAYDCDEPDFVKKLQTFGPRLRLLLDDSKEHIDQGAPENDAFRLLSHSAGPGKAIRGHFGRYAHDKVLIKKDRNGKALRVLTGSTNFSVNGLYVNANNILIFDDLKTAELYEQVFDLTFKSAAKTAAFEASKLSKVEFPIADPALPRMFITFAPHKSANVSLKRLLNEINKADSSVLFAVMALKGKGDVLNKLKTIHKNPRIFSWGVSDNPNLNGPVGATVFSPTSKTGVPVKTSALINNVPPPFRKEYTAGGAHKVHHKFVVVDFNDSDPVLFTGSSNLADGGETSNGDNLIAIYDREVATAYAVEAVRLLDHYAFRAAINQAKKSKPLRLKFDKEKWWKGYYDSKSIRCKERLLFSR